MSKRTNALAERIEQGAEALTTFAEGLSDTEWQTVIPNDQHTVGVIVHHVASAYPIEISLAQILASGKAITEASWEAIDQANAQHGEKHSAVGKEETLKLLRKNSKVAADSVRKLTDEELDRAAPVSLNANAPLTTQFFIEDHALRHSFHHLSNIRAVLKR